MNLEELNPDPRQKLAGKFKPHPLKKFFRDHEIYQIKLCFVLNKYGNLGYKIHQSQLSRFLSGVADMPKDVEQELEKIAKELTKQKFKAKKN